MESGQSVSCYFDISNYSSYSIYKLRYGGNEYTESSFILIDGEPAEFQFPMKNDMHATLFKWIGNSASNLSLQTETPMENGAKMIISTSQSDLSLYFKSRANGSNEKLETTQMSNSGSFWYAYYCFS